jgi:glycogen debranching enzyme
LLEEAPTMPALDDIILVRDRYYILATSALADDRTLVLKCDDTFAVFDRHGDFHPVGHGQQGLFHMDTRYLSRLEFRIGMQRPLLLSSTVTDDNALLTTDLTNPDLYREGDVLLARDTLHVFRSTFLRGGACYMRIRVKNYGASPVTTALLLRFEADFADIFEVRGTQRAKKGQMLEPELGPSSVRLRYLGLDNDLRASHLRFDPVPADLTPGSVSWDLLLGPGEETTLGLTIACERAGAIATLPGHETAWRELCDVVEVGRIGWCDVSTGNEQFNDWLNRSSADLRMMASATPTGPYPYAGVPWFSVPFGRDGIITALETMWVDPPMSAGVLKFLAATQADRVIPERDAEPGKILHEMRGGEMAALKEVPFERYYGSVDSTPLFLILAGSYYVHTGDVALVESIWPNLERAVEWMERHGDVDGDGFLEYARRDARGLINQGWKDSGDSVFHAKGDLAQGPIALCEVQAYGHAALLATATVARALGKAERATELVARADELRERFERAFWSDRLGTYVLALDGDKRPCEVRTSNAGHVLFSGTARPDRARLVARTLLADDSFSGWGVRTLSTLEKRYNPMSYHNGSVWPHDNALVAAGLARYGYKAEAARILTGLFDASLFVDMHRLPELFCGFPRRPAEGPTRYPVACLPQAWASGAVYMLLQAVLGLTVDGTRGRLTLDRPELPPFLPRLRIAGLRVGAGRVDLDLKRHGTDVGVNVTRREGAVEVLVVK